VFVFVELDAADAGAEPDPHAAPRQHPRGVRRLWRVHLRHHALAAVHQLHAQLGPVDVRVRPCKVVEEVDPLPGQLRADQAAADDDEREHPPLTVGVRLRVRPLEQPDRVVAQPDGVGEGFERHRPVAAGEDRRVRRAAERQDEVVVGDVEPFPAAHGLGAHHATVKVHLGHARLHEAHPPEEFAHRAHGVPRLQHAAAGFE
jgi:hypothetical protein